MEGRGPILSIWDSGSGRAGSLRRNLTADVRPGGRWRNCLHSDGFDTGDGEVRRLDLWQGGEYLELDEPERLVFTFHWGRGQGAS